MKKKWICVRVGLTIYVLVVMICFSDLSPLMFSNIYKEMLNSLANTFPRMFLFMVVLALFISVGLHEYERYEDRARRNKSGATTVPTPRE